jgi:hypothetical protein
VQDDQAAILGSNPYANIPVSARTSHGFFTISLDIHGIIKQFSYQHLACGGLYA